MTERLTTLAALCALLAAPAALEAQAPPTETPAGTDEGSAESDDTEEAEG